METQAFQEEVDMEILAEECEEAGAYSFKTLIRYLSKNNIETTTARLIDVYNMQLEGRAFPFLNWMRLR
ncbi:hypothetical protein GF354_03355 [Candidatus Peregrinibacteria bacterium]|nr:hypothetical protein [Candidatus Peregrinibacteria bacterium]